MFRRLGILPQADHPPPRMDATKARKAEEMAEMIRNGDPDAPMTLDDFMAGIRAAEDEGEKTDGGE